MKTIFFNFFGILVAVFVTANTFAAEVTDADENWHNMRTYSRMAYEWFYFDAHNSDGNQASIAFLGPNPFDVDLGTIFSPFGIRSHVGVLIQARTPDGKQWQCADYTRDGNISFQAKPFKLKINGGTLSMTKQQNGLRSYQIVLNGVDYQTGVRVYGEFEYTSLIKGWKHNDGFAYNDSVDFHKWIVPSPKGELTGWYQMTDKAGNTTGKIEFNKASAYHDHNYGTLPLADTTDGWYWGRAQVGDKTVIYSQIFGKSKPAFLGDITYKKNPASTVMFVGTENEVLVDSDTMTLNDYGIENKVLLGNGMEVPKNYSMMARGIDSKTYIFDVIPQTALSISTDYYSRQNGHISLYVSSDQSNDGFLKLESSDVLIVEQMDFVRYLQVTLGLPKPL